MPIRTTEATGSVTLLVRVLFAACLSSPLAALHLEPAASFARGTLEQHGATAKGLGFEAGEVTVSKLGDGTVKNPYVLNVELGGQKLIVVADTGSFSLVVSSKRCATDTCPIRTFDPSLSPTYQGMASSKKIHYVSGSMSLKAASDEFSLLGNTKKKMTFWEVVDMGKRFTDLATRISYDGILGMPWVKTVPGKESANETAVLELFGVKAFTVCLGKRMIRPHWGGVHMTPSFIYWHPPGALHWPSVASVEVVGKEHWAVSLSDAAVVHRDDKVVRQFGCFGGVKCRALIDTGSRINTVPSQTFSAFLTQLGGRPKQDCSNFERLPDLHFRLGDVDIVIPRRAYVKRQSISLLDKEKKQDRCDFLFEPADPLVDGVQTWILGVPFFQEFVVEFDRLSSPARVNLSPNPGAVSGDGSECPSEAPVKASGGSTGLLHRSKVLRKPQEITQRSGAPSQVSIPPNISNITQQQQQQQSDALTLLSFAGMLPTGTVVL